MTNRILLVAVREFRQIAATRSFWITLLLLPFVFAVEPVVSRFLGKGDTERVMLIDRSGSGVGAAIVRQLQIDHQRAVLTQLARHVRRHKLDRPDPAALWASGGRWYSDQEVERFLRSGGARTATASINALAGTEAPAFEAPVPKFSVVPVPAAVAAAPDAAIGSHLESLLRAAKGSKAEPLDYAVVIPADFDRSPVIRLWANGSPTSLVPTVQEAAARELRTRYFQAQGVAAPTVAAAATIAPVIEVAQPAAGSARERMVVQSVLPLACAYLLLMSLLLSGSWMLQGSVEERSNKLIEAMLACVSPNELMYGKLVGTVAIGLSMVATWILCGVLAAYATQGIIADSIRPALGSVSGVGAIATIIYFFSAGYVMVAMVFLVIGAMCDSMRDAQGYLTPLMMVLILPTAILMQAVLRGNGHTLVEVLTWIPVYTPFAVLARLGTGMPVWQVVAAGTVLAVFIAIELVLLARLFRASLLASGQRASLNHLIDLLRRPS